VLPFFGPSSIRDGVGLYADSKTSVVLNVKEDPVKYGLYVTDVVRTRAGVLEAEKTLDDASDRYAFIRDFYMARRQSLVYDGNPPREKYIDEED
jgi:phospholipid-binding lipoprotein MlaA